MLEALASDGRVQRAGEGADERFSAAAVHIPLDVEAGWETAVLDHFRAVCVAIASKLGSRDAARGKRSRLGGATMTFEVHQQHPQAAEVVALLGRMREQADELWHRVSKHNQTSPVPEHERTRVTFYFGQNVIDPSSEEHVLS